MIVSSLALIAFFTSRAVGADPPAGAITGTAAEGAASVGLPTSATEQPMFPLEHRVVGFVDAAAGEGADCAAADARWGRCIEEVRFYVPGPEECLNPSDWACVWSEGAFLDPSAVGNATTVGGGESDPVMAFDSVATWRGFAEIYAELSEDMAYRWYRRRDVLAEEVGATHSSPPATEDSWEAVTWRGGHSRDPARARQDAGAARDLWVTPRDLFCASTAGCPSQRFRMVTYAPAKRQAAVGINPPMVLVSGRFAIRNAANKEPYEYDLMDVLQAVSQPFYEQFYPHELGSLGSVPLFRELQAGEPDASELPIPPVGSPEHPDAGALLAELESRSARIFTNDFAEKLGVEIASNAIDDYTDSHIRVLAATAAMRFPPHWLHDQMAGGTEPNPATAYQTDPMSADSGKENAAASRDPEAAFAEALKEFRSSRLRDTWLPRAWALYRASGAPIEPGAQAQLPVGARLEAERLETARLTAAHITLREVLQEAGRSSELVRSATVAQHGGTLPRAGEPKFQDDPCAEKTALDADARITCLVRWTVFDVEAVAAAAGIGAADEELLSDQLLGVAVDWLLRNLPGSRPGRPGAIEQRQRSMMMVEEAQYEMARRFDTGGPSSPRAVTVDAAKRWVELAGRYGYNPTPLPQGPGAVDPVSICSTEPRLDGREEDSFQAIYLDVLVVAPLSAAVEIPAAELERRNALPLDLQAQQRASWAAEDARRRDAYVLHQVRAQAPFLLVDDPNRTRVNVTPLVGLPGDRAIWRLRWELWSGWHVFWTVRDTPAPWATEGTGEPAPMRLGALTAAVCSDMVLAAPELIPTLTRAALLDGDFFPTVPLTAGSRRGPKGEPATNEEVLERAQSSVSTGSDLAELGGTARDTSRSAPDALIQGGEGAITGLSGLVEGRDETPAGTPATNPDVRYIREHFRRPLTPSEGDGIALFVFDATAPGARKRLYEHRPHTPYATDGVWRMGREARGVEEQLRARRAALDQRSASAVGAAKDALSAEAAVLAARTGSRRAFTRVSGWVWWLPTRGDGLLVSPAYRVPASFSKTEVPRWRRNGVSDWTVALGGPAVVVQAQDYACGAASDEASCALDPRLPDGAEVDPKGGIFPDSFMEPYAGLQLDAQMLWTRWFVDDRRTAFELGGLGGLTLAFPEDRPRAPGGTESFPVAASWYPKVGLLLGFRFAPDPGPFSLGTNGTPWGDLRPNGRNRLGRFEAGVRLGPALSWGLEGPAAGVALDLWAAPSLWRIDGPYEGFAPWHPGLNFGAFVRGELLYPLGGDVEVASTLDLENTLWIIMGVRTQLRVGARTRTVTEVR